MILIIIIIIIIISSSGGGGGIAHTDRMRPPGGLSPRSLFIRSFR